LTSAGGRDYLNAVYVQQLFAGDLIHDQSFRMENQFMNPVRFGVIGMGVMGAAYSRMLAEGRVSGAVLSAVCDSNPERLRAFSAAAPFARHTDLLQSGTVDAIIIATPHAAHVPVGIDALNAGLHVVVDKPIAPTVQSAAHLLRTPLRERQVFAVMLNQRTDPCYQHVRKMVTSGELGTIYRMNWIITDWFRSDAYYALAGWRTTWKGEGGGVLLNQAPHQLDLWQWMFGMPARIRAFCGLGRFHRIEVEDDVTAYLEYANGARGVFITTTGEAPGTNRLEIAGDNGKVVVENAALTFTRNKTGTARQSATTDNPQGKPETETFHLEFPDRGEQHCGILRNVVGAIQNGDDLISPAAEGFASVELANAMVYSSLKEITVDFPLDGQLYDEEIRHRIAASTAAN